MKLFIQRHFQIGPLYVGAYQDFQRTEIGIAFDWTTGMGPAMFVLKLLFWSIEIQYWYKDEEEKELLKINS